MPVPHELFITRTAAQAGTLYPEPCPRSAACLGAEPRIWVIGVGRQESPYQSVTSAQAAVLRPRYRLSLVKHQRSLTMFLLTRTGNQASVSCPEVNVRMKRQSRNGHNDR